MRLGNDEIIRHLSRRITPFSTDQVGPASYDVRLGYGMREIAPDQGDIYIGGPATEVAYRDKPMNGEGYYALGPLEFALGTIEETIDIPTWMDAEVDGRSSIGRLGLFVHVTAGYIDPGFKGQVTLELFNATTRTIYIKPGERVCQLVFTRVKGCSIGYGDRPGSKYQGQQGATGSRLHMDRAVV